MAHAFAFGKPMVTSDGLFMEDIMRKSQAGFTCLTASDYINNIVRLCKDQQLYRKLSKNAIQYVKKFLSWDRVAAQHVKVYRKSIGAECIPNKPDQTG